MLLRKVIAFICNCSECDDPEACEVVTYLIKQVVIAIDLLFIKKLTAGFNLMMKKVLERLKAIENKVSVCTEVILLPKAGKFSVWLLL